MAVERFGFCLSKSSGARLILVEPDQTVTAPETIFANNFECHKSAARFAFFIRLRLVCSDVTSCPVAQTLRYLFGLLLHLLIGYFQTREKTCRRSEYH